MYRYKGLPHLVGGGKIRDILCMVLIDLSRIFMRQPHPVRGDIR